MLPTILAQQLQEGLREYVATTFPMTNAPFRGSLDDAASRPGALFLSPYACAKLPFRVDDGPQGLEYQRRFRLDFAPYAHQRRAFDRLCGDAPQSTLVATGTGSGKTECFLYPILDYCRRHLDQPGVKALVVYPMNALASDQARRFAKTVWSSDSPFRGVRVGMYVGAGRRADRDNNDRERPGAGLRVMSPDRVITDRDVMRECPPDVLLTNYKMLDYLLDRPADSKLWDANGAETLRYIVVDELHSFDGAQGTDLACLLRRLKARLGAPARGFVCAVGTSATLGGDPDQILEYASRIFDEDFPAPDALVGEDRLQLDEFFPRDDDVAPREFPDAETLRELRRDVAKDDVESFLARASVAWLGETFSGDEGRIALGERLKRTAFFRDLSRALGGRHRRLVDLVASLSALYPALGALDPALAETAVASVFALASHARSRGATGALRPFLEVRTHLWFRELRQLVATVDARKIDYALAEELNADELKKRLPAINCRECGATGWASVLSPKKFAGGDLRTFYNAYFRGANDVRYFIPWSDPIPDGTNLSAARICPNCFHVEEKMTPDEKIVEKHGEKNVEKFLGAPAVCPECGGETIPVLSVSVPLDRETDRSKPYADCPLCGTKDSLALVGLRCATETSATISQIFSSRFNTDKKTLAFSDSVQDAAHRAGFFNHRAQRFTVRGAIQRFAASGGAGLDLETFSQNFVEWHQDRITTARRATLERSREASDDPVSRAEVELQGARDFVGTFAYPSFTRLGEYRAMLASADYDPRAKKDDGSDSLYVLAVKRLRYEIMLEYGRRSGIGRTLERSLASCLSFSPDRIRFAARRLEEVYRATVGELAPEKASELPRACEWAVVGLLDLFRRGGAFQDPTFSGKDEGKTLYLDDSGNRYLLTNTHLRWAPGLNPQIIPRFLLGPRTRNNKNFDRLDVGKYKDWIDKCFDFFMLKRGEEFECGLLKALVDAELVAREDFSYGDVYMLNKYEARVSTSVARFRCECGCERFFASEDAEFWDGAPCPRRRCVKTLRRVSEDERERPNYYGRLYSTGDTVRVVARDHTGLLERKTRETLEEEFKRDDVRPWLPNVLSCTPTLEMGIDVGDLSTTALCGAPRGAAQFQQRAGRSGRRDGNSLTVTIANARPRDLFFYAAPLDLIEGSPRPPRAFLNAPAVLQRQFIAYCMDCWIKDKKGEESLVPKTVGTLLNSWRSSPTTSSPHGTFPNNFLAYVAEHKSRLTANFFLLFERDGLEAAAKRSIEDFVTPSGALQISPLAGRFESALDARQAVRDSLAKRLALYSEAIKEAEARPKDKTNDERIQELKGDQRAVQGALEETLEKDVYNFMTDEGLVPNYAFPEEGVVLKALLYRKELDGVGSRGKRRESYEYSRSAAAALSEFAPDNHFYAEGRKLEVNQIDLGTAKIDRWRFCPNCSHAEIEKDPTKEDAFVSPTCPVCGDPGWSDVGQVKPMIAARMVCSIVKDEGKCQITDETDDRSAVFYFKQTLVETLRAPAPTYQIKTKDFSFAYQFVEQARLREVNFGERDVSGARFAVDGREDVRNGFRICRDCGCVQTGSKPNHASYCRQKAFGAQPDYVDGFFLYREFESEALKALVPTSAARGSDAAADSFASAFMLGMTEYFGNIDHLGATTIEEPDPQTGERRQFLIVYDSVPGGTGFLKQFQTKKDAIRVVLAKALEKLRECSCKDDPEKDGCFRCLFKYRRGRGVGVASRRKAMEQLSAIVDGEAAVALDKGWSQVDFKSVFDSELEENFIQALARMGNEFRRVEIVNEIVGGRPGFRMTLCNPMAKFDLETGERVDPEKIAWDVEPQVPLNERFGVAVQSRPDFILWPKEQPGKRPIAVFVDGFAYHFNTVGEDTTKRESIRRTGKFWTWSVSFSDVQQALGLEDESAAPSLNVAAMPCSAVFDKLLEQDGVPSLRPESASNMELLMQYLERPNAEKVFVANARALSCALFNLGNKTDAAFLEWRRSAAPVFEQLAPDAKIDFSCRDGYCGLFYSSRRDADRRLTLGAGMFRADWNAQKPPATFAYLDDSAFGAGTAKPDRDDPYFAEWHAFWRAANFLQFNANFYAASHWGLHPRSDAGAAYAHLGERAQASKQSSPRSLFEPRDAWAETFEALEGEEEETLNLFQECRNRNLRAPDEIGADVCDARGRVIGYALALWTSERLAFAAPDAPAQERARLEASGWRVIATAEELNELLNSRADA